MHTDEGKTRAYVRICRNIYTYNKIRATDCSTHTIPEKKRQEFVRTGKGIYHTPKVLLQGYIYVVCSMIVVQEHDGEIPLQPVIAGFTIDTAADIM